MYNSGNFNRFFFVSPFPKGSKKEALNRFQSFFAPTLKGESFEDSKGNTTYDNLKKFEVTFLSFFKTIFNLAPFRDGAKQIGNVFLLKPLFKKTPLSDSASQAGSFPSTDGCKKENSNKSQSFFAPTLKGESFEDNKGDTAYSNLKKFEITFLSFFKTIFNLAPFRDGAKPIGNVKLYLPAIILFFISILSLDIFAQRFPKPEFESGFVQEPNRLAFPRSNFWEYLDVLVLLISMSLITWLVLKKRSRRGVFWMSVFSILYFGFFREGCVCSVGSLQNITLALFEPGYHIPLTVIAFFLIPLIFALFFGRTFCAGVCPLGAIQDLVVWKPIQIKPWLQKTLGMIPFIYLGLGVLYAATATDFVICRYDPFVGFYRLDAEFSMFALGGIFLLVGVFIARPYCRFFCPYGVLLNWMSRFSKYHMSITPAKCIQCKLCETSCPFGAIEVPEMSIPKEPKKKSIRRFMSLVVIIPALVTIGIWTGHQFHETLAIANPKVKLAEEVMNLKAAGTYQIVREDESLELEAYRRSGQATIELYAEAREIIDKFKTGSMWLGGFLGLVFGLTLTGLSIFKYREDYEPNRGECFSCARCMDYCPVEPE